MIRDDFRNLNNGNDKAYLVLHVHAPKKATLGSEFEYVITVINNGEEASTPTKITNILPDGIKYISHTSTKGTVEVKGKFIEVLYDSIGIDETVELKIKVKVNTSTITPVMNVTYVTADNNTNKDNREMTIVEIEPYPEVGSYLVIDKHAPSEVRVNDEFEYTIGIANPGNEPSTKTTVIDILPDNIEYISMIATIPFMVNISGRNVEITFDSIPATSNIETVTLKVKAKSIGKVTNKVSINASNNNNKENTFEVSTDIKTEVTGSFLETQIIAPNEVNINTEFEYKIKVKNIGKESSIETEINDVLPDGIELVEPPTTTKGVINIYGGTIVVNINDIDPFEEVEVTIKVKALIEGEVINVVEVDSYNNDNENKIVKSKTNIISPVKGEAFLVVKKTGPSNIALNDEFEYEIRVQNQGKDSSIGTVIYDTLPVEVKFISLTTTKGTYKNVNNKITVDIGQVDLNEIVLVKIKVKAISASKAINTASVFSQNNKNLNYYDTIFTDIKSKEKLATPTIKKPCYNNISKIHLKNFSNTIQEITIYERDMNSNLVKSQKSISLNANSCECICSYNLPSNYRFEFDGISDNIDVSIMICCGCCFNRLITKNQLIVL